MKYIFELNHPKHYYQFKEVMQRISKDGHEILILARDKDVLLNVLKEEGVSYTIFGKHHKTMVSKILGAIPLIISYLSIARKYKPDVIVSKGSWYGTFTAKLIHKTSIIFLDSEVVELNNKFVVPMCSRVITPGNFKLDFGKKHFKVNGLFEDCYLSPQVYQPNYRVIEKYGLRQPYAVVRFVGWFANHDVGKKGFSIEEKIKLVESIAQKMTVYISSEKELPKELISYKLPTPASAIHDVLSFADLYVGDSQTMAAEASLLGTPAIRSNSFVGQNDMSNFIMLQEKYGLLYNVAEPTDAIELAINMSSNSRKKEWIEKRNNYYTEIGDCNAQIVELLEKN